MKRCEIMTQILIRVILFSEFSSVVSANLYEAFDTIYDSFHGTGNMEIFAGIFESWVNRKSYPIVTISVDSEMNLLNINQKQFWSDPEQSREDGTWWIPLNFATLDNPDFDTTTADERILLQGEASLSVRIVDIFNFNPNHWFIVNVQQTGYYRVNYDADNWNRIIQQLKSDSSAIHVLNRASLLDDIFTLANAGDVSYERAMEMSTYLKDERDYIPWASVLTHFDDMDRLIHSAETNTNLMKFIAHIIENAYASIGIEENEGEEMMEKFARTLIVNWACRVGNEECREKTHLLFINFLENDVQIDVNIQSAVYCASLRTSIETEFASFMSKLVTSDDQDERGRMIDALGCSANASFLKAFLESSLDTNGFGYREVEKTRVILSVLKGNRIGANIVINFFDENHEEILGE